MMMIPHQNITVAALVACRLLWFQVAFSFLLCTLKLVLSYVENKNVF